VKLVMGGLGFMFHGLLMNFTGPSVRVHVSPREDCVVNYVSVSSFYFPMFIVLQCPG
jgi:hypothetical protein